MNKEIFIQHLNIYQAWVDSNKEKAKVDLQERIDMVEAMQSFTKQRIDKCDEEDVIEMLSSLWSMSMWGNKRQHIEKIISDNGLENLRNQLANLFYGTKKIEDRWDEFRTNVKGLGVATISELLNKMFPDKFMLWNGKAKVGFNVLQVKKVPQYDGAIDGKKYVELNKIALEMIDVAKKNGFTSIENLLALDYFIWQELQDVPANSSVAEKVVIPEAKKESEFVHNDIRDKIKEIGQWLGFNAYVETTVADGARVGAVWDVSIGNMGKVSYVFEVQTHGSIDSLILNLQRAKNNKTVQGIVAVSDAKQLEQIRKEVSSIPAVKDDLRYWDYTDVIKVYESLQYVNETINKIGLVPEGL